MASMWSREVDAWRDAQATHRENERQLMRQWDSLTVWRYTHRQQLFAIRADGECALILATAYAAIPQWRVRKVTRLQADRDLWVISRHEEQRWRVLGEAMDFYGIERISAVADVCDSDPALSGSVAFRQAAEARYVAARNAAGEWLAGHDTWLGPTPDPRPAQRPAQEVFAVTLARRQTPVPTQANLWEMGELSA